MGFIGGQFAIESVAVEQGKNVVLLNTELLKLKRPKSAVISNSVGIHLFLREDFNFISINLDDREVFLDN
jgi:hypothetical protein